VSGGRAEAFQESPEVAFNYNEKAALAGELLGVAGDAELDHFLGSLTEKAAGGVSNGRTDSS
jgi:hypothetical protein